MGLKYPDYTKLYNITNYITLRFQCGAVAEAEADTSRSELCVKRLAAVVVAGG